MTGLVTRSLLKVLATGSVAGGLWAGLGSVDAGSDPVSTGATAPDTRQSRCCEFYPYDGSWRFVRIQTSSYYGGYRFGGGWTHDYPDSDRNLSTILREMTHVDTRELYMGGNVLTFEDPLLMQFPFAYVSEPGDWRVTEAEARGLREYLLKGGFVVFDDFFGYEMANLHEQMQTVFPELSFVRLDGTEDIWDSFYRLDALAIYLTGPRKYGTPEFWGLFEDNDKSKRMLAIANAQADVGDLWEWAANGLYGVDPTNEAFRIGINYVVYSMTH